MRGDRIKRRAENGYSASRNPNVNNEFPATIVVAWLPAER